VVTKCSRLLRLGSRPSAKLLKAVIGTVLSFVSQRLMAESPLQTATVTRVTFANMKSKPTYASAEQVITRDAGRFTRGRGAGRNCRRGLSASRCAERRT